MLILPCGIAVIKGDTHISEWVTQEKKLTIASKYLAQFRTFIPIGGTVVDAGAMIGDHTATYAEWVGPTGNVYAFEPNPEAFECLEYNMRNLLQVSVHEYGLSDRIESYKLNLLTNAGASYLSNEPGTATTLTLDSLSLTSLDFLKIDIEGFETRMLQGAKETIARFHPVMLIEVNSGALIRASSSRNELLSLIKSLGYNLTITDNTSQLTDPQYDVICE